MRVFMLSLFAGFTVTAPQGYNYQIEVSPSGNSVEAIPNQYNFIYQQQQRQQQQEQLPQLQQFAQTVSLEQQGGYQFGNQLLQNAQQVIQFEQHQELPPQHNSQKGIQNAQQHQKLPQQQQQHVSQHTAPVVAKPPTEIIETTDPPKPVEKPQIIIDPQPQFIIQSKITNKPEAFNHAAGEDKITFQKEFYYLSAPKEEEDENPKDLEEQLKTLKKNLRVVFIKAPENNGLEKAALQLAQQSINSQTAIYVLTKQHSASELAQKLQSLQTSTPQRPEVAFIKYRTPEEAEHAQRVIQAQYEALDGPNLVNRPDTGVTHNFVGANVGGIEPRNPTVLADKKVKITKPVSKYLPTAAKH